MADDEKNLNESDDWLDDFERSGDMEASVELDQASIDEIFGSIDDAFDEATKSGGEQTASTEEDSVELDQSNIDDLLNQVAGDSGTSSGSGTSIAGASEAADEESVELDQSNIDDLLSEAADGASTAAPQTAASVVPADGESEDSGVDGLAQENIDALLSEAEEKKQHKPETPPASAESEEDFEAETVNFSEIFGEEDDGSYNLGSAADVDDDDFGFGDIPDIPEGEEAASLGGMGVNEGLGEEDLFADTASADAFLDETRRQTADGKVKPAFMQRMKSMAKPAMWAGVAIVILLGGGGFYFFKDQFKKETPAIILPQQPGMAINRKAEEQQAPGPKLAQVEPRLQQEQAQSPARQPAAPPAAASAGMPGAPAAPNTAPVGKGATYAMQEKADSVPILLEALDAEGDQLDYRISDEPEHGRISGKPPVVTYLPDKDFPGEDRFEFMVSDGSLTSSPAVVMISGPELVAEAPEEPKVIEPKKPLVLAEDVLLAAKSTEEVIIDWAGIWRQANGAPMEREVRVEMSPSELHGNMAKLTRTRYVYQPDPYWAGKEVIRYRFRKGGVISKQRTLVLDIASGNPPPDIELAGFAQSVYQVGETVVIDASRTMDDRRQSLIFQWQQVSGVPVQLEAMNDEVSMISFIMPSSFYTVDYPAPVIKLTAIDETGLASTRDITVNVASRQESIKWSGLHAGETPGRDERCIEADCPSYLLPWANLR